MAGTSLSVEVKGTDKVIRDLNKRLGWQAMRKKADRALKDAADQVLMPVIRPQIPPSDPTSPWRRPATKVRHKGPMSARLYSKRLRIRTDEVSVLFVVIKTSYLTMVVRGTRPHDIPNAFGRKGFTAKHPGAKSNDIFGRAMKGGVMKKYTNAVLTLLMRP